MAKKKRRRKGRRKMTAKQRKYFGPKKTKKRRSKPVAKKRRRRSSRRRSSSRRRGGGGGGLVGKILPPKSTLMDAAGAGIYGYAESAAKKDPANFLNKLPRPIAQLGYAGGTAFILHLANAFLFKNRYVSHLVNGITSVAAYQMGRAGGMPTTADTIFSVAGDDEMGAFDDNLMDQLAGEVGDDDIGDDDIGDDDDDISGLDVDNPAGMGGLEELGG